MSVQFILGRSGTGKTSYCTRAIVDALLEPANEQSLILLVPEQASYQAERAILADERIAGYHRLHVLSFDRLQFLLLGKHTARPALTRIGQQMIMQRILRDNSSRLKAFGSSATLTGLGRQMAQTISELHQYGKTGDDIEELVEKLGTEEPNSLAALKFADIGLILSEYMEWIQGKFVDPDVQLLRSCQAVAGAGFVRGAKLWVDGFAGFTTGELAILAELLKAVAEARIALCLDPSHVDLANPARAKADMDGLFGPTERTYAELVEIVRKCKLGLVKPIILKRPVRFSRCRQLAHIEQNIFKSEAPKAPATDNIRVVSAPNARAEVRFVAREILRLVKEKNCRYRDIAVIASDIESYQHYIRAYFEDYGIPLFIDTRKPLNQHPLVQLIFSALQAATGGFCHGDIFAYLKTDLVPIERRDVDLLENYCLAFGVDGTDWKSDKEWHFAGEDEQDFDERHINRIRLKVRGPLLGLRDRLCPENDPKRTHTGREFAEIIFDFLASLRIHETIVSWIERAAGTRDYATAEEHRQFYDKLLEIFEALVEVFGSREMTGEDYFAIINSAFSQLTLAFIPPSLDQVLVGSVERSRHPDLKAVCLVGATQKQFPVPVGSSGLLSDDDRCVAESAGFQLAPTVAQKLSEHEYLAYIAFTRPSEYLYVTYPLVDGRGGIVPRSQFIDNLQSLFENLKEESLTGEQIQIEKAGCEGEVADLLCSQLGKDSLLRDTSERERLGELLSDMCEDEQFGRVGAWVVSATNYDNHADLDRDVVENLFGRQIRGSATRLGTFAACPYRHFARYILELQERKEFKLEPLDLGILYHCVLDGLLKRLKTENRNFGSVESEELLERVREQILQLVQTDSFISNFFGRSEHNRFVIHSSGEALEDCVLAIAQMVRAGQFRPALSEIWFGEADKGLGEYRIGLSNNRLLFLRGKIDRLDIANIDGGEVAIVFDYKRRDKSFSWAKLYHGLDMQLPIYMLAVRGARKGPQDVAGAFYMPVEVNPTATALDELARKAERFAYKAKGIFNGRFAGQLDGKAFRDSRFYNFYVTKDGGPYGNYGGRGVLRPEDFEKILKFTDEKVVQLAEEILSGKIDVRPYRLGTESACSNCEYKPVCRFDWQVNDYNSLESLGKVQVLAKVGTADGREKD